MPPAPFLKLLREAGGGGWFCLTFWLLVILGCASHWLTPHLPMVDLPQHAGQIAALSEMARGEFIWRDLVELNLLTPYLTGYLLTALLAVALPVWVAMAVMLSLAYLATILLGLRLRKAFGAPAPLDFLLLPSFFGVAWHYGSYNFLLAVPLVLWFTLQASTQARAPEQNRTKPIFLIGFLLLTTHILAFGFAALIGGLGLLLSQCGLKRKFALGWPYLVFGIVLLLFPLLKADATQFARVLHTHAFELRLFNLVRLTFDGDLVRGYTLAFSLLWLLPFALGFRINWAQPWVFAPLLAFILAWLFLPKEMFGTSFVYHRFALYGPLFYLLIFTQKKEQTGAPSPLLLFGVGLCVLFMAQHISFILSFMKEERPFTQALASIPPQKRVLMLMADPASPAFFNRQTYTNWPLWYQAEKQGWVDFNFAFYFPQVVRYRDTAAYAPLFETVIRDGKDFSWRLSRGWLYDYFILRGTNQAAAQFREQLQSNPDCEIVPYGNYGDWSVLRRSTCRTAP
jgi:hypothetical protein